MACQPPGRVGIYEGGVMSTKEEWRGCCDGFYEVSDRGRVRRAKPGPGTYAGRLRALCANIDGYYKISMFAGHVRVTTTVHQLVATAFIGPCPVGLQVNHIDGNKTNNNVSNLEYVSGIENAHHAMRTGLMPKVIPQSAVDRVRFLRSKGMLYKDISKETGVGKDYCRKLAENEYRTKPL